MLDSVEGKVLSIVSICTRSFAADSNTVSGKGMMTGTSGTVSMTSGSGVGSSMGCFCWFVHEKATNRGNMNNRIRFIFQSGKRSGKSKKKFCNFAIFKNRKV